MSVRLCVLVVLGVAACNFNAPTTPSDGEVDAPTGVIVEFDQSESGADELSGTIEVPVVLVGGPATGTVTVSYAVSGGTATPGVDFTVASNSLAFAPGEDRKQIAIAIIKDGDESEQNETIQLALSGATGATLGAASHEVTISNELLPRVEFMVVSSTTSEDVPTMAIVKLSMASTVLTTVQLAVSGTATPGADFGVTNNQTVTFQAGETMQVVAIGEVDDALDEDDETVVLQLMNASPDLVIGPGSTLTHTIVDADAPPTVQFEPATDTVDEDVGSTTLTVTLSAASGKQVSVAYESNAASSAVAADAVVVGAPGTLTFAPGDVSKTITVTVTNDTLDENSETVVVDLVGPGNATLGTASSHTLTIADDDPPPTIRFTVGSSSVGEGTAAATLIVELSTASGKTVIAPFSINAATSTADEAADFTLGTISPLTFAPGTLTQAITFNLIDDNVDEADETVVVSLNNPNNATLATPSSHTLTITDNDNAVTVSWDPLQADLQRDEGNPGLPVRFSYDLVLSAASAKEVTVPIIFTGDAGNPSDYFIVTPLPVVFQPGQIRRTVTIDHFQDLTNESGASQLETVVMTIDAAPTNAVRATPFVRTHTINDDD